VVFRPTPEVSGGPHRGTGDLNGSLTARWMALAQVVGTHIDDRAIVDGRVALERLRPLSRLGYPDYGAVDELIPFSRPGAGGAPP